MWVKGQPIDNAPESVRLFWLCENMKWSHLPVAGGLYDQHPRLLEEWAIIFAIKNEHARKEAEKQEREAKSKRR